MKRYNGFQIKLFMAFLMVFDHLDHISGLLPGIWAGIFHALTRCVGVWFAYMAVEGFIHSRSRIKYNGRLFVWAAIMFGGNSLLNYLFQSKEVVVTNNIFFTLAIGVLVLNIAYGSIDTCSIAKQKAIKVGRVIVSILLTVGAFLFGAEGAIPIIPFMIICYRFRNNLQLRDLLLIIMAIPLIIISYNPYNNWIDTISMMLYNCEGLFISVIPFLYLYNGERGLNNKFSKYFFYVFYPAHLWIITTIAYLVK